MNTEQRHLVDYKFGGVMKGWESMILEKIPDLVNLDLRVEKLYHGYSDCDLYRIVANSTLLGEMHINPPEPDKWSDPRSPLQISFSELVGRLRTQVSARKSREKKRTAIQQKQLAVFGKVAPYWAYRSPETKKARVSSMLVACPRNTGRYDVHISLPNNTDPVKIMILRDKLEELLCEVTGQDIKPC